MCKWQTSKINGTARNLSRAARGVKVDGSMLPARHVAGFMKT
ncbi:MAG TPA: hypothetical protein VIL74_25950 [Pyrinomonadaceae bacterium]